MNYTEMISIAIALGSLVVAGVSARSAWKSVGTANEQLAFVKRKIGMVSEPSQMTEVLPVWYISRMSQDTWGFGLLLASGDILAIQCIDGVSDDGNWMEVTLLEPGEGPKEIDGRPVLYAGLKDRCRGSVRVDQVQAAFELLTS
ncbi:hypothetical protein [Parvibaculum sp.]|uniref:hypothetical protein n=1 Tax=Parvibaculum sp. TaxID=2024848 RepID=UPI001AFCD4C9|nr:hypothetical protein [Parvibaculum sp.]MBO6667897.1 hypothetical protein [Parvibaculum sp.]MBO6690510.1 hypothetical protein [Parvibaculum sp.]MBO6714867.1 hypothetical protein [Parvibaculum sp.]